MITDIRNVPDQDALECDLCIIGGGAAGISLALEFAGTNTNVILLESGGFDFEPDVQDLYIGENAGLPYYTLDATRLRYFGGSTNHWAGWCRPFDPIDFEKRDWVRDSGWPITYKEFSRYLPRAAALCELPSNNYDPDHWISNYAAHIHAETDTAFGEEFRSAVFQFSTPTRFGEAYRDRLDKADNIKVFLNANVFHIDTNDNPNIVDAVNVKTLDGTSYKVAPKAVVLAAGGIENARLLLASNNTHKQGLANGAGLVGRYFADHLELASGYILSPDSGDLFNSFMTSPATPVTFAIDLTSNAQKRHRLLNMDITLHSVSNFTETSEGFGAVRRLKRSFDQGQWPDNFFSDVGAAILNMDDVFSYLFNSNAAGDDSVFLLYNRCEVVPNPDSRITLSGRKDKIGMPRTKLDWRLTEQDYLSIEKTHKQLGKALGQNSLGRVKVELENRFKSWPAVLQGGHHHMGSTRMAADPKHGVVDANCRTFDIGNLYVAGSSVFPTYGKANPTLNLLALTMRLADHLKQTYG
ncbi:MAG: GMC family oxidoreductase [Pseudomonadota bacterium]